MNIQAAKNTAMIVASFALAGAGFFAMMSVAPIFTMSVLAVGAVGFLTRAIYNIECSKIDCERSQDRLRELR